MSEQDLSQINLTGGFPDSSDLAPSIVFTIVYALSAPVLIYRLARKESRTTILIRPTIFLLARLAAFILRAVMSKTVYGEGELIGELVLISVGTLFLVEPLISLWKKNIESAVRLDERPQWVQKLAVILKVLLLGAIGTAIGSASSISGALGNPSKISTVKDLRQASSILTLVVIVIAIFANLSTTRVFSLDTRRSGYLLIPSLALLVVAVYRIVQTYSTSHSATINKPVLFWVLNVLFELIAYISYLAVPLNVWYPGAMPDGEAYDVENQAKVEEGFARRS